MRVSKRWSHIMVVPLTQCVFLLKERLQEHVGRGNRLLVVGRLLCGDIAQCLDGRRRVEDGDRHPREHTTDNVGLTQGTGAYSGMCQCSGRSTC